MGINSNNSNNINKSNNKNKINNSNNITNSNNTINNRVGMIQDPVIFYPLKQAAPGGRQRGLAQNRGTSCRGPHNRGCNILESILRFCGHYHFTFP